MEGEQAGYAQAALCHRHEEWGAIRPRWHLGELEAAQRIRDAVKAVIKHGRILTPDLGGTAKTTAMTNIIIDHL